MCTAFCVSDDQSVTWSHMVGEDFCIVTQTPNHKMHVGLRTPSSRMAPSFRTEGRSHLLWKRVPGLLVSKIVLMLREQSPQVRECLVGLLSILASPHKGTFAEKAHWSSSLPIALFLPPCWKVLKHIFMFPCKAIVS